MRRFLESRLRFDLLLYKPAALRLKTGVLDLDLCGLSSRWGLNKCRQALALADLLPDAGESPALDDTAHGRRNNGVIRGNRHNTAGGSYLRRQVCFFRFSEFEFYQPLLLHEERHPARIPCCR